MQFVKYAGNIVFWFALPGVYINLSINRKYCIHTNGDPSLKTSVLLIDEQVEHASYQFCPKGLEQKMQEQDGVDQSGKRQ